MAKKGTTEERAPMALYRKYRPMNFDDIRGDQEVVAVLRAAVAQGKVAHAYLFAGGRGTGKNSMARILARALGTSEQDIYEMDAASNRGIDEAHALTRDAWGALLKTLEEPPAHAIFVLATTELDRVPDTILSRCQTFNFKKPSHETLKQLVLDVAKKEGASLESAAAELIALMGEGAYRDTLGILQKVPTVSSDKKMTEAEVAKVVGAPAGGLVNSFLTALAAKNIEAALDVFHKAAGGGTEPKVFALLAITKVRAVLLLRFAPKLKSSLAEQFGADDLAFLQTLAKEGTALNALLLAELLTALIEMNRAPLPQIPLELALYRALG